MKKAIVIFSIIVFIVILSSGAFFYLNSVSDNNTSYKSPKLYICDGIVEYSDFMINDDNMYISESCLRANDLLDLYWDKDFNIVNIFNDYNHIIVKYNVDEVEYNGLKYSTDDILKIFNGNLYLNAEFLDNEFIDNMFIDKVSQNVLVGKAKHTYKTVRECKFYYSNKNVSTHTNNCTSSSDKNIDIICEGTNVYVYENIGSNAFCLLENGRIGYIDINDIRIYKTVGEYNYYKPKRMQNITLAWDLFSKKTEFFEDFDIPDVLDVIAPTWYELNDTEEIFFDYSQDQYIDYVHSINKKIWATFNNSFDSELTNKLLNNPNKRTEIVNNIISIVKQKNYDGINIDFENVYMKDRDVYSALIEELYCQCLKEKIIMSVDVAVLSSSETWSKFLDRKAIGKYSDYVILMAYDQHVNGVSGSVGSIPWIEYGVKNLLESVNEGKVILAMPFYTRLWEETTEGNSINVKSTSLKAKSAQKVIEKLGIKLQYDEETGQNYGEKIIDGVLCRVWNEDEISIKNRLLVVKKYNLVGKGVWAFDYGTDELWDCLE